MTYPAGPTAELPQETPARASRRHHRFDPFRPIARALSDVGRDWRAGAVLQAALLIVGTVYCCITYALWTSTQQAIDQAREQTFAAQRAWITVANIALAEPPTVNRPVRAAVTIKNTGQTPAFRMTTSGTLAIRDADPGFVYGLMGRNRRAADMGAGETQLVYLELDNGHPLQPGDLPVLDAARQHLYAIVEITYADIFGHSASTRACAVYAPATKDLGPCTMGNELR
jgi:hypothetical protein